MTRVKYIIAAAAFSLVGTWPLSVAAQSTDPHHPANAVPAQASPQAPRATQPSTAGQPGMMGGMGGMNMMPMKNMMGMMQQDMGVMMKDMSAMITRTSDPSMKGRMQMMHEQMATMMDKMQKMSGGMKGGAMMRDGQNSSSATSGTPPAARDDHEAHSPNN